MCYFPAYGSTNPDGFLAKNLPNPKGNHPSKFQLAGVRRFGGVREQTNKQTNTLTHSLRDWCLDKRDKVIQNACSLIRVHPVGVVIFKKVISQLPFTIGGGMGCNHILRAERFKQDAFQTFFGSKNAQIKKQR